MNTHRNFTAWAAALAILASATQAKAFNQDHYFLYKSVTDLQETRRVAASPDGKIYVTEWTPGRFSVFDQNLNLLTRVGGISNPYGIDVAKDGTVYVVSHTAGTVRKYDGSGNYLGDLATGLSAALDVRLHPVNGNIYVQYGSGDNFRVFKPDGSLVTSFAITGLNTLGFDVSAEGKVYAVGQNPPTYRLFNTLGIQETLPFGGNRGYDLRIVQNRFYWTDPWTPRFGCLDQDGRTVFVYVTNTQYSKTAPHAIAICPNGDIATTDTSWRGSLFLWRRCEGNSMGPETRNASPLCEITSLQQRPNSTLLDIEYKVTDLNDPTVHVAAAAFKSNTNDLDNMVLMNTLAEGTAANVGPNQPAGQIRKLTWDAGADWGVDFGDIAVHLFVRDSRQLLMGLHFVELPAEGANPAITITRSPVKQDWFMEPLMWLAASKNPSVTFSVGRIHGVGGSFGGELLASGTTVTQKGREFVESLMGVREATAAEVQGAREAATPGIVNQWDTDRYSQKVDQDLPRKVNEYGFDTGSYDSTWFWLVKVN